MLEMFKVSGIFFHFFFFIHPFLLFRLEDVCTIDFLREWDGPGKVSSRLWDQASNSAVVVRLTM